MKRILASIALAALLLGTQGHGVAVAGDTQGPACTEIQPAFDGAYTTTGTTVALKGKKTTTVYGDAIFTFSFSVAATPCAQATYSIFVTDSSGGSITATYPATAGNEALTLNGTTFSFSHDYGAPTSAPATLQVVGETAIGGHVADRAPNLGSLQFDLCESPDDPATPIPACTPPSGTWDN